jgi:hypothetical protein
MEKINGIKEKERTKYKKGRKVEINRKSNKEKEMNGLYKEQKIRRKIN